MLHTVDNQLEEVHLSDGAMEALRVDIASNKSGGSVEYAHDYIDKALREIEWLRAREFKLDKQLVHEQKTVERLVSQVVDLEVERDNWKDSASDLRKVIADMAGKDGLIQDELDRANSEVEELREEVEHQKSCTRIVIERMSNPGQCYLCKVTIELPGTPESRVPRCTQCPEPESLDDVGRVTNSAEPRPMSEPRSEAWFLAHVPDQCVGSLRWIAATYGDNGVGYVDQNNKVIEPDDWIAMPLRKVITNDDQVGEADDV